MAYTIDDAETETETTVQSSKQPAGAATLLALYGNASIPAAVLGAYEKGLRDGLAIAAKIDTV